MLTREQIEQNKQTFIDLVKSISIEGAHIDELLETLEKNDFYYAPATAIAHGNYVGGLCEHSLNVYKQLKRLVKGFAQKRVGDTDEVESLYSEDTIKIVGLFHDISKANYYEKYTRNVKNEDTGRWDAVESYKIIDSTTRETFGEGAVNSYVFISKYIPLLNEEIATIINFNCGMDNGYSNKDIYGIMEKYPLVVLLHTADMISSFIDKK